MTRDSTSNVLDSIPLWASLRDSKGQRADKTLMPWNCPLIIYGQVNLCRVRVSGLTLFFGRLLYKR
jgi:hypothetical protein